MIGIKEFIIAITLTIEPSAHAGMGTVAPRLGKNAWNTLRILAGATGYPIYADGPGATAQFNQPRDTVLDSSGNLFVADSESNVIRKITPAGVVSTFAGRPDVSCGADNGTGTVATFCQPTGLGIDSSDNLYVADNGSCIIRKITPAGVVTTLAGSVNNCGRTNGTGSGAKFNSPEDVAVDGSGNVFVADAGNHEIRKITPAGVVTLFAGSSTGASGSTDATGTAARFYHPSHLVFDSSGNLFVTDSYNCTIRKITTGAVVTTFAGAVDGWGYANGTGSAAVFNSPTGIGIDSSNNLYIADEYNYAIRKITTGAVVTTFAGAALHTGSDDGTGSAARFGFPGGLTVDGSGNLFVADRGSRTIRKVTSGAVVTTFAGAVGPLGSTDGAATDARFNYPQGMVFDSSGNLFVADTNNHVIRKITPAGVVSTFAGTAGSSGSANGTGSAARFFYPVGIAIDTSDVLYVTDSYNCTIRKITTGAVVTTFAGSLTNCDHLDGTGTAAHFNLPRGIAVNSSGIVYVVEHWGNSVRKITAAGVVTTLAGGTYGSADGTGAAAQFANPIGVTLDSSGNLYVADTGNRTIRKVTAAGVVTTIAGSAGNWGSADGTGAAASFSETFMLAADSSNNIYITDFDNYTIRKMTTAGVVTTFAGSPVIKGFENGFGSAARFNDPIGVATDSSGNVYISDTLNFAIRKITPAGYVTTYAGPQPSSDLVNSVGPNARFSNPTGVINDSSGNLFVTDSGNNGIRKVTASGFASVFAGSSTGDSGSTDATGTSARFFNPQGITRDSSGNLYVADTGNHTIRKITPAGVVTTLAGSAGLSGSTNGTGSAARFNSPASVTVDTSGNVYVADKNNYNVRKITSAGVVTTLAGATAWGSTDATGTAASFSPITGIVVDSSGNLFVTDHFNHTIRKITSGGVVTTFAGSAGSGGYLDATGTAARFSWPSSIAIDSSNNLYVNDLGNGVVRKITPAGVVTTVLGTPGAYKIGLGSLPGNLYMSYGLTTFAKRVYITTGQALLVAPLP